MFLFFLASSCILKHEVVSVRGFIPSRVSSFMTKAVEASDSIENTDIILIESPLLNEIPRGKKEFCVFSERISEFHVFKSNSERNATCYIDPKTKGAMTITSILFDHGYEIVSNSALAKYIIQDSHENPIDFFSISLDSSPFSYLIDAETAFHLYSNRKSDTVSSVCQKKNISFYSISTMLMVYLVLVAIYYMNIMNIDSKPRNEMRFWIIDNNGNIIYGPPVDILDNLTQKAFEEVTKQVQSTQKRLLQVIRLERRKLAHTYYRIAGYPMSNGFMIVCVWAENIIPQDGLDFECKFNAKNHIIKENPKIYISTLRAFDPLHVSFKLDNNVEYDVALPVLTLSPSMLYGKFVVITTSIFDTLIDMLNKNPYIHTNFGEYASMCCAKLGTKRAFFFLNDGSLIYQYTEEGLKEYLSEEALRIPSLIKGKSQKYYDDLLGDGLRCYVNQVSGYWYDITSVFAMEIDVKNKFFETYGMPFFSLCCVFMYQLSQTKEQSLRFERFIHIFTEKPSLFTFCEITFPSNKVIVFRSKFISKKPKTLEELKEAYHEKGVMEIDYVFQEIKEKITSGELNLYQKAVEIKELDAWVSVTTSTQLDDTNNESIITILVEDISEIKQTEHERIEEIENLKFTYTSLSMCKYIINDGKVYPVLPDVFQKLGYKESSDIGSVVFQEDKTKFENILTGGKATIRLLDSKNKPKWYSFVFDGEKGYAFCAQDIIEVRNRLLTNDEALQLSGSELVFWNVNVKSELVRPVLMQPTIWDTLSVDREMKFSRFVDFVHADEREQFQANYYAILQGKSDKWEGDLRVLRVGETYEWYHLVFYRSKTEDTIHCFSLNINSQKEAETQLQDTQKLRDLLLSSGKLTLWQFNDNHDPIEHMNRFDPGLMNIVSMNWIFVQTQIHPDYRELFSERLRRAFEHDDCIEMDLPLLLDEEIWVSLRGKLRSASRQIVGVCIDITELRNAYNELEKEKKKAEEANKKKTVFLANMSHEIRTPMNGIFGMLDVLALQELTGEQRLLVDSIRSSSFQLMKLLDDTLNLSKIEQGEIESNPSIYDLSKIFEPICIATASRARLNKIKLNVYVTKNFPILLYGDSQLFVQVLNNLLSNALKFTKEGAITIRLSWVEANGSEFCILEVSDTGIGITKEQQRIVFERFSQADASVARFYGGTGLGLSLVQEIVRFLGGSVSVESELGHGTKFIVEVPFESIYVPYSPPFSDGKRHIVMISVEDELLHENLIEWIEYQKYTVIPFKNIDEIDSVTDGIIDAIFVEGNREMWPKLGQKVSQMEGKQPHIVSMCEAGEPSYFKFTIAKPVQYFHLITLLNSFRYNKISNVATVHTLSTEETMRKILVVEDNKANQFVMKKILESIGCTYMIAENGKEALSVLDHDDFDLVFMDCQMPVMDGLEATKVIRRSGKLYASIPIIALTASAVEGDEQTCREAGMDGYLAKPVRIQQITDVLRQFNNHAA